MARPRKSQATLKTSRPARVPPLVKTLLGALAVVYLAGIWLGGIGSGIHAKLLPRPALFLTQVSCLFPKAMPMTIEYAALAQDCRTDQWREVELTPIFPIHPNDKENRFHRAMFFHRRSEVAMTALDAYIWAHADTELSGNAGAIQLLSLRIPFPEFGTKFERYRRRPVEAHPSERRHVWWTTPAAETQHRCRITP